MIRSTLRDQIVMIGRDDMMGAGLAQGIALGAAAGRGDGRRANHARDLDGGEADAAGCRRNDDGFAGAEPGDLDERAVGGQVLHPCRGCLDRRLTRRRRDKRTGGDDDEIPVRPVVVQGKRRDHADRIAGGHLGDVGADRVDNAGGFIADPRRQLRRLEILPGAEKRLGAVQADRLDPQADLAGAGLARIVLLDPQHLRSAQFMKAHELRHPALPFLIAPPPMLKASGIHC